ncbi:MAG: cation diffusion facilitator family transporter [Bacteroidales bacterium]|nr:cation diffusion facilitator family transporter [Bacteroidales bacterium]
MGHLHNHHHHEHGNASKNIGVAFFLNLGFSIIELVGGLLTNSVAILSDALHDFGDSISLAIAYRLEKISQRGRDEHYTYGYKRFSLLGALFISVVLLVGSVFILKECAERILSPQEVHAEGMLILAVFGILVNGAAIWRLNGGKSLSQRAVRLHLLEDVLGWIAVLIVSAVMLFVSLPILDPLLSIGITLWVLYNVYRNLSETFRILLQEAPQDVDVQKLQIEVEALPGVKSIHDVHVWSLDGMNHVITLHVVTECCFPEQKQHDLKMEIRRICNENGIGHATIEIEAENEGCSFYECDI